FSRLILLFNGNGSPGLQIDFCELPRTDLDVICRVQIEIDLFQGRPQVRLQSIDNLLNQFLAAVPSIFLPMLDNECY
ncbi:MAG: hypothetical protein ACJ75B_06800, partial [Flavisolibacter sp.]